MSRLILVPTQLELNVIAPLLPVKVTHGWTIELCGFGPIAAASRSAALMERLRPSRVMLLGIAGTFEQATAVGTAMTFGQVHCWGIGVGSGENYCDAAELGFPQWDGEPSVGQCVDLSTASDNILLTCCAASANAADARQRKAAVPTAAAEDMEGYGVALSCRLANVPLTIVRGISNQVGDRNRDHWQVEAALTAAAKLALEELDLQR